MAFALALPDLDKHGGARVETVRLAAQLDRIPTSNPLAAAHELACALAPLNRSPMSAKARRDVADLCHQRAKPLWAPLERSLHEASHPLRGHALAAVKSAIALASELDVAARRCVAESVARRFGKARELPALIHRSQLAAGRLLSICYVAYAPVPAGTWHDIHEIYALALRTQLHRSPANRAAPALTPERAYVQTLLLALANPYGLLPGELGQVVDLIGELCSTVSLVEAMPVHRIKAMAVVPVGYDFPPFAGNKGGSADGRSLYLLTFDLAFRLHDRLHALERGAPLPRSAGQSEIARRRYVAMVRRLLRQWGDPPTRTLSRLATRATVLACFGVPAVWQATRSLRTSGSIDAALLQACRVVNRTPTGFALRLSAEVAEGMTLRVGELIGLQDSATGRWRVGAVRWFRNALEDRGIDLGCEVLGESAQPATARAEGSAGVEAPTLALALDAAHGSAPSLVLPSAAFEAESGVMVRRDREAKTVVLTKLVEHTPSFERFEYLAVP